MKHISQTRITAFIMTGVLLTSGITGAFPALTAQAAGSTDEITIDLVNHLRYRYVITGTNKCVLRRVSDENGTKITNRTNLELPDKIPGSNYEICELGYNGEAIMNSSSVKSVQLPNCVKRINNNALYNGEIPNLKTLRLNLKGLDYCDASAFGHYSELKNIFAYNKKTCGYDNLGTISNFEKYYSLVYQYDDNGNLLKNAAGNPLYTQYQCTTNEGNDSYLGKVFRLTDENLTGEATFLNAVDNTPYCKNLGYQYAIKIVSDNGFDAPDLTKQQVLEMIYNYLRTHERYSRIRTAESETLSGLMGTSLSALALNSGVCGSFAHSFEQLCRATGKFTFGSTASGSDVVCVGMPDHVVNAVRLSPNQGYYIIDASQFPNTAHFMQTVNYRTTEFTSAYLYGTSYSEDEVQKTAFNFTTGMLANQSYCGGDCFMQIANQGIAGLKVEVYYTNHPSRKYINYTGHATPNVTSSANVSTFSDLNTLPQFIPSTCYFTIKVGGKVISTSAQMHGKEQKVTVGNKTYNVVYNVLTYASTGVSPANGYQNYYKLTIKKA